MTAEREKFISLAEEMGHFYNTDLEMRNTNVGIGVLVVHLDTGTILMGKERSGKEIEGKIFRKKGELSIPTETRKLYEPIFSNVQAAILEEMYFRDDLPLAMHDFSHEIPQFLYLPGSFDGRKHFMKSAITVHDDPAKRADLIIVGYQGPSEIFNGNNGDLDKLRWIDPTALVTRSAVREASRRFLGEVFPPGEERSMMGVIQNDYKMFAQHALPLFPHGFSNQEFLRMRRKKPDAKLLQ